MTRATHHAPRILEKAARAFERRTTRKEAQREPREWNVDEKDGGKAKPERQPAKAIKTGVDPRSPIAEQFADIVYIAGGLAPDILP